MTQNFTIVNADDLAAQAQAVQLPSQIGTDKAVLLKRPDLISLIAHGEGDVPDVLSGIVVNALGQKPGTRPVAPKINADNLTGYLEMIDQVVCAAFVQPQLSLYPKNGAVAVGDLTLADRMFVFGWALGGEGAAAERFPEGGQAGNLPPAPDSDGLQQITESDAGIAE